MTRKKILRPEMAFVILWDPDKNTIYLQRKDSTYWVVPLRFKYCFVGTGIRSEDGEKPFAAVERKLADEMTDAQWTITNEMRFWKTFHLRWGTPITEQGYSKEEGYTCHMFVRMTANRYEMMRIEDDIRGRGRKRATPANITLEQLKKIPPEEFMGSLNVVAKEFLMEVESGSEQFWNRLTKKR